VEGGRTYLGRSASCPWFGTEGVARLLIAVQKSAEGIVTRAVGAANEALQRRKAEHPLGQPGTTDEGPNGPRKGSNGEASTT